VQNEGGIDLERGVINEVMQAKKLWVVIRSSG